MASTAEVTPPPSASNDDDGDGIRSTPPELTTPPPPPTWRKKPSQKGKPRLRLVHHARTTTPKRPVAPPHKKRKAGDGGVAGKKPKPVRRKLDLDDEGRPPASKISTPAVVVSGSFRRAALMDNLKSLAKLHLGNKKKPPRGRVPPASSQKVTSTKPPPKKIDPRRCFGRAQLMENLRALAKRHNVPASAAAADGDAAKGKSGIISQKKEKKKPPMVDELVLVPYSKKRTAAAAAAAEDPLRALVVHDELAGALTLRWKAVVLVPTKTRARLVRNITPAIEAAYGQLMKLEETCRGTELPDVPESPELEEKRKVLEGRVERFMEIVRHMIGNDPSPSLVFDAIDQCREFELEKRED